MKAPIAQTATQILLDRLIDYAGLFPPASLGTLSVVTNYDNYKKSKYSSMLGRLIVPAAQLAELEGSLSSLPSPPKAWELSVLLGSDIPPSMAPLKKKYAHFEIKSIETKATTIEDIHRLSANIPPEIETYIEIPLTGKEQLYIEALAQCGRRAKIRTGGETLDKFPACDKIAEFLHHCAQAKIFFKATAGLHHPYRSIHALTYKESSPTGMMHGFLNVFLAAAFIYSGMEARIAKELLEEQSPTACRFDAQQVIWRNHRLDIANLTKVRQEFSVSFGSCSFTEPVEDLLLLGLL